MKKRTNKNRNRKEKIWKMKRLTNLQRDNLKKLVLYATLNLINEDTI